MGVFTHGEAPVIIHFHRIVHYKPSSYWGTPSFTMLNPTESGPCWPAPGPLQRPAPGRLSDPPWGRCCDTRTGAAMVRCRLRKWPLKEGQRGRRQKLGAVRPRNERLEKAKWWQNTAEVPWRFFANWKFHRTK